MMRFLGALSRPFLFAMDPEDAHAATIKALRLTPLPAAAPADERLASNVFGLRFPNPVGMAAGFDKGADVPGTLLRLGFGFVEIGTVTPAPQPGNPRPRLFRLVEDEAVVNRFGFNSEGHEVVHDRLRKRAGPKGIIGVNVGANKDAFDRAADYVSGIAAFADVASYFTVNISSPNTPGLRGLQSRAELEQLLGRINDERARQERQPPMLLKIAPDLREDELEDIAAACSGGAVDGIIVSNTTLSRDGLHSGHAKEQGGLSGLPLLALSTRQLARMFVLTEGKIPLVGAGGVHDGASALMKIRAGASLVQLYSALVYQGPGLVTDILNHLAAEAAHHGGSLASLRGRDAAALAHQGSRGR
jgi:dihydroorotate dehydrogenase